jgi:tetratricopeptide (TPR) repeat protein
MNRACFTNNTNLHEQNQHASSPARAGQAIRPLKNSFVRMKRLIMSPVVFLAAIFGMVTSNNSVAQDLDAATLLTRSEQYDKAAEMFKQLIQKEPGNSRYFFFYGENTLQEYFADTISNSLTVAAKEAKDLYNKGVSANANEPLNYVGLAKVAFFLDDNKTAGEMRAKAKSFLLPYKNIKKIVPPAKDYAFTLAKLAESYISADNKVDTALALPLMREAINIDAKSRDIYLVAGDIFNIKNDGSNAIKYYNLAQEYDPKSPTANMKIGSIYVKARNLPAAIPFFEQAIALNANYAPAYRELGAMYSLAGRNDKSKENFRKYLELTQGNIPAKIIYVKALYFTGEYDEAIKNVEEIFAVDKSKSYMNRIAAYSSYEKKDADYNKALSYMETLFKTVSPDRIIKKDYTYMAKILLKKNQNYLNIVRENDRYKTQLEREKTRYANANAAEKARIKPNLDTLVNRTTRLDKQIGAADVDIDRAFGEYTKALTFDPEDKALLNEIANNYYNYRRYDAAAKTWSKLIALGKNEIKDYMLIGKAYNLGEKYKPADSIFNIVVKMDPNYLEAYVYIARVYSKMETDAKTGLARPKFEKLIEKASADSIKNGVQLMEAYDYLGYHYLQNENMTKAKDYYNRMINLDPNNKENKIKGYNGIAQVDSRLFYNEKTIEGKLVYLSKIQDSNNKIASIDPNNESAKASLKWVLDTEKLVKSGINPNELKGSVKGAGGQPLANASIRVKDTAAETYTNTKGEFKFEIPMASEVLIISAKGYKSKEVPVQRPLRPLNVVLEQ